jgi:ubiquinone/menaquinone biosynthesis C-methylase UbiE
MSEAADHYVMGYTERTHQRLGVQADLQNPLTESLLTRAGLKRGMRLDLWCGIGDVSFLAAPIVGCDGLVTGIDLDEPAQ